jgi:hypothetical protein
MLHFPRVPESGAKAKRGLLGVKRSSHTEVQVAANRSLNAITEIDK